MRLANEAKYVIMESEIFKSKAEKLGKSSLQLLPKDMKQGIVIQHRKALLTTIHPPSSLIQVTQV